MIIKNRSKNLRFEWTEILKIKPNVNLDVNLGLQGKSMDWFVYDRDLRH